MASCAVEGCPRAARTRGWCATHYERWRRTGVVGGPGDGRARPVVPCAVSSCDNRAAARGWCKRHYASWRQTGDPIARVRPTYGQRLPGLTAHGYLRVWAPEHPLADRHGLVPEHRKVAWDHGLITDPSEHVHHINGVKTDNRPENLEGIDQAEHARRHLEERGFVTNQYGTWPIRRKKAA